MCQVKRLRSEVQKKDEQLYKVMLELTRLKGATAAGGSELGDGGVNSVANGGDDEAVSRRELLQQISPAAEEGVDAEAKPLRKSRSLNDLLHDTNGGPGSPSAPGAATDSATHCAT
eukprot:SAG11_NODE_4807_length_1760_cov_0.962071_2_plen_116_part_00